jgi:hypothetical protein
MRFFGWLLMISVAYSFLHESSRNARNRVAAIVFFLWWKSARRVIPKRSSVPTS